MFNAISLAEHQENWSPSIAITRSGHDECIALGSRIKFVVLEILKNALGSTMKRHTGLARLILENGDTGTNIAETMMSRVPPVHVEITGESSHIRIVITDSGLGIPHTQLKNIYTFMHFATRHASDLVDMQTSYQPVSAPLQGLGAGLALSKVFIEQFGGSMSHESVEGGGTTVTVVLPRSTNIQEAEFECQSFR
jgi:signal transduction histidine kinase